MTQTQCRYLLDDDSQCVNQAEPEPHVTLCAHHLAGAFIDYANSAIGGQPEDHDRVG